MNTADSKGGAERIVLNLHSCYKRLGHESYVAVGRKSSDDGSILQIPGTTHKTSLEAVYRSALGRLEGSGNRMPGVGLMENAVGLLARPSKQLRLMRGQEDFEFPGSWKVLEMLGVKPDIIHCHNLHGAYFDLRALPWLTSQLPVIVTLHDAWMLGGHCAHSFDCERWRTGCGQCPHLGVYPQISRDSSAENWRQKREIYSRSLFHLSTPCQWLMKKVEQSMMAEAILGRRVIPNGIDTSVFCRGDKSEARKALGLSNESFVMLTAGSDLRRNPFKDFETLKTAISRLAKTHSSSQMMLVCLGQEGPDENLNDCRMRFVKYQSDLSTVARYYQAADVCVHSAKAETYPNTVLESMACGTPVIATSVGGISEQIEDGKTGFLVPREDDVSLAQRMEQLMSDPELAGEMGIRAAEVARSKFDVNLQASRFIDWYHEIIESDVRT